MSDLDAGSLSYRARALAQAHPLSSLARRYLDWAVAGQRTSQPIPEIGIWAGAAVLLGYCVRRVEEEDLGLRAERAAADAVAAPGPDRPAPTVEELDQAAAAIAAQVRTGEADAGSSGLLGHRDAEDDERLILALDRIVASEVANRLDHWRDSIDDEAWRELEEYITWWVVKGYAVRVAEADLDAVRG